MSDPIRDALRVATEQHNRCGRDAAGCANRPGCVCRREGAEFVSAFLRALPPRFPLPRPGGQAWGHAHGEMARIADAVERAARGGA